MSISANIYLLLLVNNHNGYFSNEVGNLIRPMVNGIRESNDILDEIIDTGQMNDLQYKKLLNAFEYYEHGIGELKYLVNRIKIKERKYFKNTYDVLQIHNYLQRLTRFEEDVRLLTEDEIEKFKIIKKVTSDYELIFHNYLGESPDPQKKYDINDETWILMLGEIIQYNEESDFKVSLIKMDVSK